MNPTPAHLPDPCETLRRDVLAALARPHDPAKMESLAREVASARKAAGGARAAPEPQQRAAVPPDAEIAASAAMQPAQAAPGSTTPRSEPERRVSGAQRATAGLRQFFGRVLPRAGLYGLATADQAKKAAGALDTWREIHGNPTLDELAQQAAQSALAPLDVYFWTAAGCGPRGAESALAKRVLHLDCDRKDFQTAGRSIGPALRTFLRETDLPPPSIRVCSGGGRHYYWVLDRDLPVADWKSLAELLKTICTVYDFPADPSVTSDLARLLRVPSSRNQKYHPPRPCRVRYDDGRSHDPDVLRTILQRAFESAPTKSSLAPTAGPSINDDLIAGADYERPDGATVKSMLPYFGDGGSRDRWLTVLQGLHEWDQGGDEGFELANQWSATQPKYQGTADVRKTWNSLGRYSGPRVSVGTLIELAKENGWQWPALSVLRASGVTACPAIPATPAQRFTTDTASLVYLIARYMWVRGMGKYLDRLNGALVTAAEIDTAETRWMTKGSPRPSVLLRQSEHALMADALGYRFAAPALYRERVGDHELTFANTAASYKVDPLPPAPEELSLIETYFSHLFTGRDGELARAFVLDAIAYLVQSPQQRWRFGILLAGVPGCGKGVLFQQMTTILFGGGNVGETNIEELARGFTGSLTGKLIRVADEVRQSFVRDGEKLFNTWKPYITNDVVSVQRKGQDSYDVHNATSHAGLTNYPLDAGYFQDNDRRWFVFSSDAPRMDTLPWVDAFFKFLRSDRASGVLKHFFLQRDVSAFNPFRCPPMTAAKSQMIQSSIDDVTAEVVEMFHSGAAPFHRDLFTLDDLRSALGVRVRRFDGVGLKKLSAIVKAKPISAQPLPYKRRIGAPGQTGQAGSPRNFWAWRNGSEWGAVSNQEIFEHLSKGTAPLKAVEKTATDSTQAANVGSA